MEKTKIKLFTILLIISILITSCKTNFLGHYYNRINSATYNSEIEISEDYLIYKASSDMLGTVIQKEKYVTQKDFIIVDFKINKTTKTVIISSYDKTINGTKIKLLPILTNDSITPVVGITLNDTIKYLSNGNDTILNITNLKKIEFKDIGLNFIKDTIINFPNNNNNNVFKIRLEGKNEIPVLSEKGLVKYLVRGKKLYVLTFDKSSNKYKKTEQYFFKR